MISIYKIKPKFQQLLRPLLDYLHKIGITANQITITSMILSFFIGLAFWYADQSRILFLLLPLGLFIRMALNALDGMMARIYKQQSRKGEVLNEIGDVISDFFIFFPLLKFEKEVIFLVFVFICLSIINEFSGILGKAVSGVRQYDGPMGKSDRAFILGIYGLLSFFSIDMNEYSFWIFILLNILILISTLVRMNKTIKQK